MILHVMPMEDEHVPTIELDANSDFPAVLMAGGNVVSDKTVYLMELWFWPRIKDPTTRPY